MERKFIQWKDEDYRDDRMFVMNISSANDYNGKNCWHLTTYRNTIQLACYRNNFFSTEFSLMKYIQNIEPLTPLISRNEQPLEIPSYINKDDDIRIWKFYNEWLTKNGLFSAVNEISHVPFYIDQRGYTEKIFTSKLTSLNGIETISRGMKD